MFSQKYTENIGNMWLIMINPQKPVINLIKMFNHFTALIKMLRICKYDWRSINEGNVQKEMFWNPGCANHNPSLYVCFAWAWPDKDANTSHTCSILLSICVSFLVCLQMSSPPDPYGLRHNNYFFVSVDCVCVCVCVISERVFFSSSICVCFFRMSSKNLSGNSWLQIDVCLCIYVCVHVCVWI